MAVQQWRWQGKSGVWFTFEVYSPFFDFSEVPCNYIFAKWNDSLSQYDALYIGETENLNARMANHEKWPCAIHYGVTHIHAHVSSVLKTTRQIEESDLVQKWNPRCND